MNYKMDYKNGLLQLEKLAFGNDWYREVLFHQAALLDVFEEEKFGPTERTRHDRYRILDQLNALCLEHLNCSFNDLCFIRDGNIIGKQANNNGVSQLDRIEQKLDKAISNNENVANELLLLLRKGSLTLQETNYLVNQIYDWAIDVKQSLRISNEKLSDDVGKLSQNSLSTYEYLQVAIPILPGLISYNIELGTQHQIELSTIWETIKSTLNKHNKDAENLPK